ncbi:glycosyltransferase family 2 protein [uncultured Ilyobacter sp.]|uniref:glycosyltransferase family 2 protein n=1 Tax=uncultured Ilyobacter sp. TaxID=544433 RepID=UPI0029C9A8EE|nr:glycosyltransferase family 2 protein [uncultured Ilyobacter sp.]
MKLSVGIITFNEEKILPVTLEAAAKIADEIVIVDSNSSDRTVEIARSFGAKVYDEEWKGFGPQKNSVIEKCSGDWILLIDADEELSEDLIERLKDIKKGTYDYEVYQINRCSVCFGKELKYGGWSNQYATRLWKNGSVEVSDNLVHEEYITKLEIGKIKEKINHYSYLTLKDYFDRFNRYTTLGAEEYYRRGKKSGTLKIVFNPMYKFFRMYFFRLGFLDGVEGFVIACTSSMYSMTKYFKLREMYKNGSYLENKKS